MSGVHPHVLAKSAQTVGKKADDLPLCAKECVKSAQVVENKGFVGRGSAEG